MERREFIKTAGAGAIALGFAACTKKVDTKKEEKGSSSMPHHLGSDISLLGYGCMRWPTIQQEDGSKTIDQEAVNELVDYAVAHGVNYFDTSPIYLQGQSEAATAAALSKYPRESYYLATKLSNHRGSHDFDTARNMYLKSLEIFGTDYIDYYLLHNISGIDNFLKRFVDNGILDYMLKERESGHIRKLGFSIHADKGTFDYLMELHQKYHWDFVQIQMNYSDWNHAGEYDTNANYLYAELDKREIPVIIMEPLLGGGLAEVPSQIADEFKSKEPGKSIASWAFRFCGSFPRVLTVLSGMTYMEHLKDNLDTFLDFKPLSDEEFAMLEDAATRMKQYVSVQCTGCSYCMPCPYGIDIPGIFSFYNRNIKTGTYATSSEQKNFRKLKQQYILGYDKAVESVRQANHCIGCGKCLPRCPQHIDIPEQLHGIDLYVEKLKQGNL